MTYSKNLRSDDVKMVKKIDIFVDNKICVLDEKGRPVYGNELCDIKVKTINFGLIFGLIALISFILTLLDIIFFIFPDEYYITIDLALIITSAFCFIIFIATQIMRKIKEEKKNITIVYVVTIIAIIIFAILIVF